MAGVSCNSLATTWRVINTIFYHAQSATHYAAILKIYR